MPAARAEHTRFNVPFWKVEEYAIEVYEVDEDGELDSGTVDFYTQDEMDIEE